MSILDEIQSGLKEISKVQKVNDEGDFKTGMSIIEGEDTVDIKKKVEKALEKYVPNGEKIITRIWEGEIFDSGKAYFNIMEGYIIEFYEYKTTTSVFIRIYRISDKIKDWIAVYIDQNLATPWWDKSDLR
jgi:hypothetical protein